MKRKVFLFVLIFGAILIGIYFKYGRSTYMPVVNKFQETETVQSIQTKLGGKVSMSL